MKADVKCDCIERGSYRIKKNGAIKSPVRLPGQCSTTLKIGKLTLRCDWCQNGHGDQHRAMVLKGNTHVDVAWSKRV